MAHEDLTREEQIDGSSDRGFGIVFAVVFVVIATWPLWSSGGLRWWAAGVAALFALIAITVPRILAVPNRWWMRFGLLLSKIVSPIALGVLFYGAFMPIGLLMRALGKDPLRLKRDEAASSYWIGREPPGPPPQSMTNQF